MEKHCELTYFATMSFLLEEEMLKAAFILLFFF